MSLLSLPKMMFSYTEGWKDLVRIHPSVAKLFTLFVVPMSLIPPAMIYYAATRYSDVIMLRMTDAQLQFIALVFFAAEMVMVPLMGWVIQRLGEVVDIQPDYRDAFTLAAVAPTPLWLAPLFLFVPSVMVNVVVTAFALLASAGLIYHGVYPVFKLEDEGKSFLMAGSIFAAGLVAWVSLMVLTLVVWGYV